MQFQIYYQMQILSIKILFIVADANLSGGTEILTFNLANALHDRGLNVNILSLVPYAGNNPLVVSLSVEEYGKWSAVSQNAWNKLFFNIAADRCLRSILKTKASGIKKCILINQTYDIITALPNSKPVVQVLNWSIRGYEKSIAKAVNNKRLAVRIVASFCNWGLNIRRRRKLSRVSRLVALSNSATNEIKSLNKYVDDAQISIIPNPLTKTADSETISPLTNKNIVFVGRLSAEKGVMRLLHIWDRVGKRLTEYTLSIYGDGPAKAEMKEYINKHCIDRVIFKGFCNDLDDIYTHADLLLMTSDTEGFGMVLIEAMYYGVPCISFDCPVAPKEIIADAGITVPTYDEKAYANAVISLLVDNPQLHTLQKKSIVRARSYYIDKVVQKWLALFNQF